jgi:hypothetical protein
VVYVVPESALPHGFSNDPAGTHGSKTIMLSELRQLLAATTRDATYDDYRRAIVADNVLGKRTMATRKESLRRLRELYCLSPEVPIFRALRDLWDTNPDAQPMLAFLCASARDPILRASAGMILQSSEGNRITPQMIEEVTATAFLGRYNPTMLAAIGRNAASSWQQSGHLQGRLIKVRSRAAAHPESTTYALFLGHLSGAGGEGLFSTFWTTLLDAPSHVLREQARAAARHGWLDYKSLGGVSEINFPHLLRNDEEAA